MNVVSYNVKVNKSKLSNKIKKDSKYLIKEFANIIYKRREKTCYEKSRISG